MKQKKDMTNKIVALFIAICLLFATVVPAEARAGDVSIKVGETKTFQWGKASYENIESAIWSSTNNTVASIVSQSGQTATVRGIGTGTCAISCRVTSYHEIWDIKENRYVIQDRMTDVFSWTVTVASATAPQAPSNTSPKVTPQIPSNTSPQVTPQVPSNTNSSQCMCKCKCNDKVKSLKLDKKKLKMKRGTKKTLHCSVGTAAVKRSVKWKSSNKRVATVNGKGRVTAKRVGKANITAYVLGKKKTCKVTVRR